ncbi:unnamed protein product [Peronospora belbahrii]|uniref:Uncharacterized protein n=1 Tax=Peronospora belbahrii TaxID=622444 RepID=A0AAU9KJB8_9STRA|nr:unnamed protein product [Peronospora belbahrii]
MVGQDAVLGMDFMVLAGMQLDLADGTLCLLDEVRVQLGGRRTLQDNRVSDVKLGRYVQIPAGGYEKVLFKRSVLHQWNLWVTGKSIVSVGSQRYAEWLNLVYESTTDQMDYQEDLTEKDEGPLVEVPQYSTPSGILQQQRYLLQ